MHEFRITFFHRNGSVCPSEHRIADPQEPQPPDCPGRLSRFMARCTCGDWQLPSSRQAHARHRYDDHLARTGTDRATTALRPAAPPGATTSNDIVTVGQLTWLLAQFDPSLPVCLALNPLWPMVSALQCATLADADGHLAVYLTEGQQLDPLPPQAIAALGWNAVP